MLLEQNWMTLGPKVRGKIHISVGEADDYYLNNAVHLLDDFFKKADPPADARISYGPDRGHCWNSLSEPQMMNEMAIAVEQSNPHLPRWLPQNDPVGRTERFFSLRPINLPIIEILQGMR